MIIFRIAYWVFLGFVGIIALLLLVSSFSIPGNIKFLTVQSGSMMPTIKTGSVVMVKPESDYKIGDIITFGPISRIKAPTTHRIYDIKVVGGNPVYITKGDANNAPDQNQVQKKDVLGKVLISVPYIGYAVDTAKKPWGFALIIIVPSAIIIIDEVKKIYEEVKKKKTADKI